MRIRGGMGATGILAYRHYAFSGVMQQPARDCIRRTLETPFLQTCAESISFTHDFPFPKEGL